MPGLQPGMAHIRVKDLRLRTYIGINEDGILNQQDALITCASTTWHREPISSRR